MEELEYGPNGGLVYCFEFLMENLDWLTEALEPITEEYLIIFDLPGQIELYTHIPIIPNLARYLARAGALDIRLCAAYLLESTFVLDRAKFFAGTLSAMSAMLMLEMPHVNVLSKMDLVKDQVKARDLDDFLTPDSALLDTDPLERARVREVGVERNEVEEAELAVKGPAEAGMVMRGASFRRLNRAVANLIDSFSMVRFLKLDLTDEDSVESVLSHIDDCIQYHEAQEPREPDDELETDDGV
jgi:hypothetical protein